VSRLRVGAGGLRDEDAGRRPTWTGAAAGRWSRYWCGSVGGRRRRRTVVEAERGTSASGQSRTTVQDDQCRTTCLEAVVHGQSRTTCLEAVRHRHFRTIRLEAVAEHRPRPRLRGTCSPTEVLDHDHHQPAVIDHAIPRAPEGATPDRRGVCLRPGLGSGTFTGLLTGPSGKSECSNLLNSLLRKGQ
jgi:hypothetical protein